MLFRLCKRLPLVLATLLLLVPAVPAAAEAVPARPSEHPGAGLARQPVARAHDEFPLPAQVRAEVASRTQAAQAGRLRTVQVSGLAAAAASGSAPFMTRPYIGWHSLNSYFDHCSPDYGIDNQLCTVDGLIARKSNGYDPSFPKGYAATPGGVDYVYYDGHNGFDLGLSYEQLVAVAPGVVGIAGTDSLNPCFGLNVTIDHGNGYTTRYAHMSRVDVVPGQPVARGQGIGISGTSGCSTGPHLHFGLYTTSPWNAIDPWGWLGTPGADPYAYDTGDMWLTGNPQDPFPQVPTAVTASVAGTSATVMWTPGFDGGEPISSYTVTASPSGAAMSVPGGQASAVFTGLQLNVAYTFTVAAINSEGRSPVSAPSNLVTTAALASTVTVTHGSYTLSSRQPDQASTWYEVDPALRTSVTVAAGQAAIVGANMDLWTQVAGYNQDLGLFKTDCSLANLVAWKESGGIGAGFSPNAAFIQSVLTTPGVYSLTLCWKANRVAPGGTVWGGAGTAGTYFSPTTLTAKVVPAASVVSAVTTSSYSLGVRQPDGASTWYEVDPRLRIQITAPAAGSLLLGANMDLWTAGRGYNQDLAIFSGSNCANQANLVSWKESGGFAGTLSPNAAFVEGSVPVTAGQANSFTLCWKANSVAPPGTVNGAAGTADTYFSPTRLTAEFVPAASFTSSSGAASYHLDVQQPDGASTWYEVDPGLRVAVTGSAGQGVVLGANMDLWTTARNYNQDLAVFVGTDCSNLASLVAWKESGGIAGAQSPNAAFVQARYRLPATGPTTFTLCWKANRVAPAGTIFGGAGTAQTYFSPTRLTAELTN